jgi:hypothetical protein
VVEDHYTAVESHSPSDPRYLSLREDERQAKKFSGLADRAGFPQWVEFGGPKYPTLARFH